MASHTALMKPHITTLQPPSTAVVFTKNPSVMDSLCNHKQFATCWADGEEPMCTCAQLQPHAASHISSAFHLFVDGDALILSPAPLTSIANGSLQNKIFPPNKELFKSLQKAFDIWHQKPQFLRSHYVTLQIFGNVLGLSTINTSTNTSPTKT